MYLLGADKMGRDLLSRLIYGTRVSMSIGLVGVVISFFLGILLGGISGFYGGGIDNAIQRIIEFIRSIPTIPLWLGLAAALPQTWGPLQVYFGITIILSFIGWTGLARVVRGRFLSLRTEDFVLAARLDGSGEMRTIWKHMVPSFFSHIIASLTLAIPAVILAETSLSFLGLGLRPPVVSWGVLLQDAQNIRSVATAPWLLTPGILVVLTVLALNFLGDGMRDAADPYNR
jgi:peptide/nickel transport system permease protein